MKNLFGFGSDGIASHFINIAFPVISQPLFDILKKFSIITGMLPDSWKTARVSTHFKNGERDDRSNYRPISVLPVLSRLFEKLVYYQHYNHLCKNKHLCTFQTGFRTLRSIVTSVLTSTNDWYANIDNSKISAVIFIDLKKAFGTVDHGIILARLHHYCFYGIEYDWFRSYLNFASWSSRSMVNLRKFSLLKLGSHRARVLGLSLFC